MRLKDPLQGVKMAQGHLAIHIMFFCLLSLLPYIKDHYNRPNSLRDEIYKHAILL